MVNKLFESCKHPQNKISIENCCLKISSRMFTICKRSLIILFTTHSISQRIISCKWLINILFAVCKLFVWISEVIYQLQRYYVNNFHTVIIKVSEDFTWWSNENILLWMHQSDALWLFGTMKKKCLMKNIFKVKSTCK